MLWRAIPIQYRALLIGAAVLAFAAACFAAGRRYAANAWALRYAERETALLREIETQTAWARALEQSLVRQAIDHEAQYLEGIRDVQTRTNRTIAELRAGALRLRHELAASACELSGPAAAAGGDHAGAATGIWDEAASDLVRLADEADAVVLQLSACQGLLRDYREMR